MNDDTIKKSLDALNKSIEEQNNLLKEDLENDNSLKSDEFVQFADEFEGKLFEQLENLNENIKTMQDSQLVEDNSDILEQLNQLNIQIQELNENVSFIHDVSGSIGFYTFIILPLIIIIWFFYKVLKPFF